MSLFFCFRFSITLLIYCLLLFSAGERNKGLNKIFKGHWPKTTLMVRVPLLFFLFLFFFWQVTYAVYKVAEPPMSFHTHQRRDVENLSRRKKGQFFNGKKILLHHQMKNWSPRGSIPVRYARSIVYNCSSPGGTIFPYNVFVLSLLIFIILSLLSKKEKNEEISSSICYSHAHPRKS